MTGTAPAARIRDAERSRLAILDAAEALFAARGFDGTSLSDIGAAAGLSRATPSYFYGSKERLYTAVLEHVFAERQAATARAFEPVHEWCAGDGGPAALATALARATEAYMGFLVQRPAFVRLLAWEELSSAERLRSARRSGTAMRDAFAALRTVAPARGLRAFDPGDAVLVFVSLTFGPLAQRSTLMAGIGRDLSDDAQLARHVHLVVHQVMRLLGA